MLDKRNCQKLAKILKYFFHFLLQTCVFLNQNVASKKMHILSSSITDGFKLRLLAAVRVVAGSTALSKLKSFLNDLYI